MIIGTFGTGSAIESNEYDNITSLLNQLPDNTGNLINPSDIRDSVYTLWQKSESIEQIAISASEAVPLYTNSTPTLQPLGGIPSGSTFSNKTIQEMFDQLLYPYIAPVVSISSSNTPREFGSTTSTTLTWSVNKGSSNIQNITVNNIIQGGAPFTTNQSGTQNTNATQNTLTQFTITAFDGTGTASANTQVVWQNRRYWGRVNLGNLVLPEIPDPVLNFNIVAGSYSTAITDSFIRNLNGAGVGSGSELAVNSNKTYNGINGNGQHLIFAWPTSFGNPTFTVGGFTNTAFTKIRDNSPFTNQLGFQINYDVWISNTPYNSPVNIIIS
jgi:hypothetical protein